MVQDRSFGWRGSGYLLRNLRRSHTHGLTTFKITLSLTSLDQLCIDSDIVWQCLPPGCMLQICLKAPHDYPGPRSLGGHLTPMYAWSCACELCHHKWGVTKGRWELSDQFFSLPAPTPRMDIMKCTVHLNSGTRALWNWSISWAQCPEMSSLVTYTHFGSLSFSALFPFFPNPTSLGFHFLIH